MSIKLVKIAIANLLRHSTRTGLTAVGLALAIATVLFVNVVALSFESGVSAVYDFIRGTPQGTANVWVTAPGGFTLDPNTGFFSTPQPMTADTAQQILKLSGSAGIEVLTGEVPSTNPPLVVYGQSQQDSVLLSKTAAELLNVTPGQTIQLGGVDIPVDRIGAVPDLGAGAIAQMPLALAQQVLNQPDQVSWVMVHGDNLPELRRTLMAQGLSATTDPTLADTQGRAIAYFLEGKYGRQDIVSFDVKFAALYINQASSTLLGWLAKITLGLGFVLMLSAALLSIEERRREFGIMVAVGVSGDVLYLFLMESILLFVGSTVAGLVLGTGLLEALTPELFRWGVVLKSMVLVACYIPPMIVFGSLVPAQQLLQKSPIQLLRTA